MIRLATCGSFSSHGDEVVSMLRSIIACHDGEPISLETYATPIELIDACAACQEGEPIDMVVCSSALPGISGQQLCAELRAMGLLADGLLVVMSAAHRSEAKEAKASGVSSFILEPVTQDALAKAVEPMLSQIELLHRDSVVVRCRERMRRIAYARICYVQTDGHDQVVHCLDEDEPLRLRYSSRAMFDMLATDGRFFKVGSSYIVNLDRLESLSQRRGAALMSDGTTIPVPVRLRKTLAEALCAHAVAYV